VALEALRIIQGKKTIKIKEQVLFSLRMTGLEKPAEKPTVIQILQQSRLVNDVGLLVQSILIELGEEIGQVKIPEIIRGRKIYYAVRLLILNGRPDEAKQVLNKKDPEATYRITQALTRDPNEEGIRQTVCAW
jgi:hypothetical protein